MKKKWSWKKVSAIGAGAMLALSMTLGLVFSNLSLNGNDLDSASNTTQNTEGGGTNSTVSNYSASNNTLIADSASGLYLYKTGDTYWYTDYAAGVAMGDYYAANGKNQDGATDRIVRTVNNLETNKGTADNPYVIADKTSWDNFVTFTAKAAANRSLVYVLNGDLDYNTAAEGAAVVNGEIKSVTEFSGKFYGNGYTISNIKYNNSNSVSQQALGLFCRTTGTAQFSDLTLKNVTTSGNIGHVGGVVGHSDGNITFTGVTVTASFTIANPASANVSTFCNESGYIHYGGLLGAGHKAGMTMNIYKCSATVKANASNSNGLYIGVGSLAGCYEMCSATVQGEALNVYDSYGALDFSYSGVANSMQLWSGLIGFVRSLKLNTFKRCVSVVNVTATPASVTLAPGILFSLGQNTRNATDKYAIDNCYGYGNFQQGSTKKAIPFLGLHTDQNATGTVTNCNVYSDFKSNGYIYSSHPNAAVTLGSAVNSAPAASLDAFKTAVTGKLNNPAIWSTDAINQITGVTSTPDIIETPIVVSKTRITFAGIDGTAMPITGGVNPVEYEMADAEKRDLPKPTKILAGQSFVGWSLSKTSDANPLTKFPKNLYGNVIMYPIWDMTNVDVAITAKLTDPDNGTDVTISGSTVKAKYIGEPAVTLTASVTNAPCASADYTVAWTWYKNGVQIPNETGSELKLTNLTGENEVYTAKAILTHKTELWRTKATEPEESNSYTVQISKGTLTPSDGITLVETAGEGAAEKPVIAYWGQPLSELLSYVETDKMQNSHGSAVAGTVAWKVPTDTVKNAQQTYKAIFKPVDQANYADTEIDVTVSPTVLQLVYSFEINEQLAPKTFSFPKEYGANGNTTGKAMASEFETAYLAWLDSLETSSDELDRANYNAMLGRTPCFNSQNINNYRNGALGDAIYAYFDAEHVADDAYIVKTPVIDPESGKVLSYNATRTVTVTFDSTKYSVTLYNDYKSGTALTDTTYPDGLGYGVKIVKPSASTYTDGAGHTQFLTGWFVSASGGKDDPDYKGDRTSWGFDTDRVTRDLSLSAGWLQGFLVLQDITATTLGANKEFTARDTAKSADYVVTGRYWIYDQEGGSLVSSNVNDYETRLVLSPDAYTVTTGAGGYHTTGNYGNGKNDRVTITVIGNTTKTTTVDVKVNKKVVDMSGVYFPNQSAEFEEGVNKTVGAVDLGFLDSQGVDPGDYTGVNYAYHNSSGGKLNDNLGVSARGTYYVYFSIVWPENSDFVSGEVSATFIITAPAEEVYVVWNYDGGTLNEDTGIVEYVFNNQVQHPTASIRKVSDDAEVLINFAYTGSINQSNANDTPSSVSVSLQNANYKLVTNDSRNTIRFIIKKATVKKPTLTTPQFEYSGEAIDIRDYIEVEGYTKEEFLKILNITDADAIRTNVKLLTSTDQDPYYHTTVALLGVPNIEWEDRTTDPVVLDWTIYKKKLPVPTFTEALTYSGNPYKVAEFLNNFDPELMDLRGESGESSPIRNAGTYNVTVNIKSAHSNNYEWQQADFNGTIRWTINKAELFLTWDSWNHKYTGTQIAPRAHVDVTSLVQADKTSLANVQLGYRGDEYGIEPGVYETTAVIAGTLLNDNYTLHPSTEKLSWVIRETDDEVILTIVWSTPSNGIFTFDGNVQSPKIASIINENTGMMENVEDFDIVYAGDYYTSCYNGVYTASVESISSPFYENYTIRVRQAQVSYQIRGAGGNQPTTPVGPDNPEQPEQPGNTGDGDDEGTIGAIPQLIISGVSLVLILVFGIMTMNYASTAKRAKAKAKKLAQMSYSFAPVGLLAPALLGISDSNWWIIAGVLLGLALFTAILMFIYRGKSRRALAMLEEEQERIEEEKELAREAERDRRDNELKMMFAAMQQQNYQQQPVGYDDMQNMIASAVTALLPGLQQSMQALPPAQSQPETSEADELRAQMAQQQEMINQLLQNQQAQQQSYAAPAQAYAEPEPPVFTDDETISLEELYGKMSDDAKRLYYEIGGYIMGKPDTAQNDGKYSVLFKHRGKTLFKLCIKNDAPVLYYALDNGTQGEAIISDLSTLEMAKGIVDLRISQSDR